MSWLCATQRPVARASQASPCAKRQRTCAGWYHSTSSGSSRRPPSTTTTTTTTTTRAAPLPTPPSEPSCSPPTPTTTTTTTTTADAGPLNRHPVIATTLDAQTYAYLLAHTREPAPLARLRGATEGRRGAHMQVAPEQGALLALLAELVGARRCLEVGVFTGYSALAVALALRRGEEREEGAAAAAAAAAGAVADGGGDDDNDAAAPARLGRVLVALDRDEATMAVAREAWRDAGVAHLVDARVGPALPELDALLARPGQPESYDLAFIDADKRAYGDYYERCLRLVRPGGLVVVDNVLFYGRVATAERADGDKAAAALRAFNAALLADERVSLSMLPVGDGMTLCWKRFPSG